MLGRKSEKFIVKPEERKTSELKKHSDDAPGVRRVFLDERILPEAGIYLMVRSAKEILEKPKQYVQPHKHGVDSFFVLIGDEEELTGLKAEVAMGDKTFVVDSPATVFIPRNVSHHYRLIGGSGKFLNIVLNKNYNKITK